MAAEMRVIANALGAITTKGGKALLKAARVGIRMEWLDRMPPIVRAAALWWGVKFANMLWEVLCGQRTALSLLDSMIPFYNWIRSRIKRPPKVEFDVDARLNSPQVVLESLREGSPETEMGKPKCQAAVGVMEDGVIKTHGNAVRVGDFLLLPEHVWSYNRGTKGLWLVGKNDQYLLISEYEFFPLDTDIGYVRPPPDKLNNLGIGLVGIAHYIPVDGAYAQIVGARGRGSTGVLRHDTMIFGRVTYDGSTSGGYSGAAYMAQNQLAAVHTSGGRVNGGYSAEYLWISAVHDWNSRHPKEQQLAEDTADWLQGTFAGKRRVKVDRSWSDLDEVRIFVDGRYAIVPRKDMSKAFGSGWSDSLNEEGVLYLKKKNEYLDVLESGEQDAAQATLGGLSIAEVSQGQVDQGALSLIQECGKLPSWQQNAVELIVKEYLEKNRPSPSQKAAKKKKLQA